jgi:DNA topoisomerase III
VRLYLCEKPAQGADLAKHVGCSQRGQGCVRGNQAVVTWCIGHLLEQAMPQAYGEQFAKWSLESLPVVPSPWQMNIVERTKSQFAVVRELLRSAADVVIATDADREGEVIAREVLSVCGYRGAISRLWLQSFDGASVKKGLSQLMPEPKTRQLYFSGLGRARADWLMGMNITRALTTAFGPGGKGGVLHCGRVQTPVLGLVVRRERAIAAFKPKTHYTLDAAFSIRGMTVPMDWMMPKDIVDAEGHCLSSDKVKAAAAAISNKAGRVSAVQSMPERELAPLPYYLGSLQKEANKRYGMKPNEVLEICQALYETYKATTYPRTDSEYLPSAMWHEVPQVLEAISAIDPEIKPLVELVQLAKPGRCFNDAKVTGHFAIIPNANTQVNVKAMKRNEQLVYDLIRRRYIAQFLGEHKFTKTTLQVTCEALLFSKVGKATVEPGWLRAELPPQAAKAGAVKATDAAVTLPRCEVGDQALNVRAEAQTKKTKAPERYTDATLLTAMESIDKEIDDPRLKAVMREKEKAGIGTDATRGDTIAGLVEREYIAYSGKQIAPTERGNGLVELLEKTVPSVIDPVLTAIWEDNLSQVEKGTKLLKDFEAEIAGWLVQVIDDIRAKAGTVQVQGLGTGQNRGQASQTTSQAVKCPQCNAVAMQLRNGAYGAFWKCGACQATANDVNGVPVVREKKPQSEAPLAKPSASDLAGKPCPTCNQGKLQLRNLSDSPKQFWGCTRYRDGCRHFAWA